jgi:transcriptional regulator with XRE-family HTH domain
MEMEMRTDAPPAGGETIGQRLKRLRLEQGFSQRELAAPGVSYAYISRIEAGTRQPSVKALRRLAGKLGVTADYLETGSQLAPEEERELLLADLELGVRLGDARTTEEPLRAVLDDALHAGDRAAAMRARVAVASVAYDRADWRAAIDLLEAALAGETFDPLGHAEIYAHLGRAYSHAGRGQTAVELYERCIAGVVEMGGDSSMEARYSAFLCYVLIDMGEVARAEEVVSRALGRLEETEDPYMRVRLYWSMARLAHAEGRASVALDHVRRAIALLQATDDTLHLARAHTLAANIMLSRDDPGGADHHLNKAELLLASSASADDLIELAIQRSRVATLRGSGEEAARYARRALELNAGKSPADEGRAFAALADGLSRSGELQGADEAYRHATELLESQERWRDAASACREWARMLRQMGREEQAMDVLERATELGMRAAPASSHAA